MNEDDDMHDIYLSQPDPGKAELQLLAMKTRIALEKRMETIRKPDFMGWNERQRIREKLDAETTARRAGSSRVPGGFGSPPRRAPVAP